MQAFSFDLTGKKAIVTGGAGDIGFAIASLLHAHGAAVALIDRVKKEIPDDVNPEEMYSLTADLSVRDNCRVSFEETLSLLGGVDILVNAAGIIRREDAEKFSEKDWDEVIRINLDATFLFCQMAGNSMIGQGGGRIINIASMNGFDGGKRICSYSASKGAVVLLTKALSNEWSGKGINVNAIAPGYIETQINTYYRRPEGAEAQKGITARIPMGRWGTPEDVAGTALFLVSDAAAYVSGVILPVDGGYQAN